MGIEQISFPYFWLTNAYLKKKFWDYFFRNLYIGNISRSCLWYGWLHLLESSRINMRPSLWNKCVAKFIWIFRKNTIYKIMNIFLNSLSHFNSLTLSFSSVYLKFSIAITLIIFLFEFLSKMRLRLPNLQNYATPTWSWANGVNLNILQRI